MLELGGGGGGGGGKEGGGFIIVQEDVAAAVAAAAAAVYKLSLIRIVLCDSLMTMPSCVGTQTIANVEHDVFRHNGLVSTVA